MCDQVDDDTLYESRRLIGPNNRQERQSNDNSSNSASNWPQRDVTKIIIGVVLVLMIIFNTGASMSQLTIGRQHLDEHGDDISKLENQLFYVNKTLDNKVSSLQAENVKLQKELSNVNKTLGFKVTKLLGDMIKLQQELVNVNKTHAAELSKLSADIAYVRQELISVDTKFGMENSKIWSEIQYIENILKVNSSVAPPTTRPTKPAIPTTPAVSTGYTIITTPAAPNIAVATFTDNSVRILIVLSGIVSMIIRDALNLP